VSWSQITKIAERGSLIAVTHDAVARSVVMALGGSGNLREHGSFPKAQSAIPVTSVLGGQVSAASLNAHNAWLAARVSRPSGPTRSAVLFGADNGCIGGHKGAGMRDADRPHYLPRCAEPREELRTLIELGYASKDPAIREAAGIVDTWRCRLNIYLHTMGMQSQLGKLK
jgi:hypothetical protein